MVLHRFRKLTEVLKIFLLLVIITLAAKTSKAQDKVTGFLMPTLSINYKLSEKFSQSVEIENRNFGYLNDEFRSKPLHLEFQNSTKFEVSKNHKISFSLRYRVAAQKSKENEFRLHQQYEWKQNDHSLLQHRIRTEERFYDSGVKFRLRYKTGISYKTKTFCDAVNFANEVILEVGKMMKPEYEERLLAEAEWNLSANTQFAIGTQYRFGDFTRTRAHDLFLTAGLSFDL